MPPAVSTPAPTPPARPSKSVVAGTAAAGAAAAGAAAVGVLNTARRFRHGKAAERHGKAVKRHGKAAKDDGRSSHRRRLRAAREAAVPEIVGAGALAHRDGPVDGGQQRAAPPGGSTPLLLENVTPPGSEDCTSGVRGAAEAAAVGAASTRHVEGAPVWRVQL